MKTSMHLLTVFTETRAKQYMSPVAFELNLKMFKTFNLGLIIDDYKPVFRFNYYNSF